MIYTTPPLLFPAALILFSSFFFSSLLFVLVQSRHTVFKRLSAIIRVRFITPPSSSFATYYYYDDDDDGILLSHYAFAVKHIIFVYKTDFTAGIVPRTIPRPPPYRIASRLNIFLYFCPKRTLKYYASFVSAKWFRGPLKIISPFTQYPRDNCYCYCCCCCCFYWRVNIRTRFMTVHTTRCTDKLDGLRGRHASVHTV